MLPLTPMKDATTGAISDQPMFWIYYPDAIKTLAQANVSTTSDRTWYDVLEASDFKANMIKLSEVSDWKVITPEQKRMLEARGIELPK